MSNEVPAWILCFCVVLGFGFCIGYDAGITRGTRKHACEPFGARLVADSICIRPDTSWTVKR